MCRALAVLLLYSGCAFGLSGPDPDRPRSKPPQCDTGKGLVVLDGAMAMTAGLIAIGVAESEPAVALVPLSIGAIYLAGAVRGNRAVDRCRRAMAEYESYLTARETLPPSRAPDDDEPPGLRAPIASRPPPPLPGRDEGDPVSAAAQVQSAPRKTQPVPPSRAQLSPSEKTTPVSPAPSPATAAAPPAPAKSPAKPPAPAEPDDDWSDFWREVE